MKPTIRLLAVPTCLAVAAALAIDPAGAIGPAGARSQHVSRSVPSAPIVKTKKIAPGLLYTKIIQRQVPRRTFVLKLDLSKAITLDTTIADAALPSRAPVSEIVRDHGALAGVNGDYAGIGNPVHPFAQDGELLHTAEALGTLFAVSRDESQVFFGRPEVSVSLTDGTNGRVFTLDRWNQGAPAPGEIAGFSPLGGTLEAPPPFSCSVRLLPQGPPRPADGDGVDSDFVVDEAACSESAMTRAGGIVISAAPATDEAPSSSRCPLARRCSCTGASDGRACSTRWAGPR